MIIGIDASRANKQHKTGPEWYAYYLIRNFALIDSKNEYILYTNRPLEDGLLDLDEDYKKNSGSKKVETVYDKEGYQILNSPHNNFKAKILTWPCKYFWTLGGLSIEMFLRKPDVLFIPSHVLPIVRPKKSIVTIHDIGFIKDHSFFAKDKIGPDVMKARWLINKIVKIFTLGKYGANSYDYFRWSTKFALKYAACVIAVSNFSKNELLSHCKFDKTKIKVIHNGYNSKLYKKIDDAETVNSILSEYGIEQPYFFYIGRLDKKKNIASLVEAYAILCDKYKDINHKLVLVGDANFGYDEIKYMTREFDLVNDVIMPGWIDEEIIPYLYSGASAFVFPSKYEGFGIPLLQAMACGVPVAASKISSIPEVAGEAAVYFNPEYSLSIAEAMYRVVSDKELVEWLIDKGQKRVKNFSWEKCAKETLEIITKI